MNTIFGNDSYKVATGSANNTREDGMIMIDVASTDSKGRSRTNSQLINIMFTRFHVQQGERVQIVEAFNDAKHLFVFGSVPTMVTVNGVFVADRSNPGLVKNDMTNFYNRIRAYTSAIKGEFVAISVPGSVIRGVVIRFEHGMDANNNSLMPFTIQLAGVTSLTGIRK